MKTMIIMLAAAGLVQAATSTPPTTPQVRRDVQDICVRRNGDTAMQVCKVLPGRLSRQGATCDCPNGSRPVQVFVCQPGVQPPADSAELRQTRLAASSDGSLVGDMFQDQEICVSRR